MKKFLIKIFRQSCHPELVSGSVKVIAFIRDFIAFFISFLFLRLKRKDLQCGKNNALCPSECALGTQRKEKERIVPLFFRYSIEKMGTLLQKSGDFPPSFSILNRKRGVLPEPPLPSVQAMKQGLLICILLLSFSGQAFALNAINKKLEMKANYSNLLSFNEKILRYKVADTEAFEVEVLQDIFNDRHEMLVKPLKKADTNLLVWTKTCIYNFDIASRQKKGFASMFNFGDIVIDGFKIDPPPVLTQSEVMDFEIDLPPSLRD